MLLSVIIPVYNGERTIERCLSSIIEQSYSSIELIVINDGSTDNTKECVKKIIRKHPDNNIRLINQNNCGLPQSRKRGVDCSNGEYIGFVDSDDWIESDMYSVLMEEAISKEADIVCCDMSYDYPKSSDQHIQKTINGSDVNGREALFLLNNRMAIFASCENKVFKKSLFKDVNYPKDNLVGEDYFIVRQLLLKSSRVIISNNLGYHYVQHSGSMVRGGFDKNQFNGFVNYYRLLQYSYLFEDDELKQSTDNYIINEFLWIVISMYQNKNYNKKIIKWIKKYVRKRLLFILKNSTNSLLYKVSCIVFLFNHRLLGRAFVLYDNKKNNMK